MLASSNAGQDANSDVSAIFDELTVELRSQPKSSSEIRQSAYLQHKADFQELVTKGARLFKLMIAESTSSAQSSFTDVEDLQKWGYHTYNYNDASELRGIDSVLDTIEVSKKSTRLLSPNIPVSHTHKTPVVVEGMLFPATNALLCQVINISDGIIVAYDNFTAQGVNGRKGSSVPPLNHWSDIAYLQWLSKAEPDSNLRFVLRYNVINDGTCFALDFMESHCGFALTQWPGTTYYPGSNEFNALLGSPNGQGVAHMLIQHRKQLGHRAVEKVIIFFIACRGKMLLFHLQDVEETSRHDACS